MIELETRRSPGEPEAGGEEPQEALDALRRSLMKIEARMDAQPGRSWIENWMIPFVLLAVLLLQVLHGYSVETWLREDRLGAELLREIALQQEAGQIFITDRSGVKIDLMRFLRPQERLAEEPRRPGGEPYPSKSKVIRPGSRQPGTLTPGPASSPPAAKPGEAGAPDSPGGKNGEDE